MQRRVYQIEQNAHRGYADQLKSTSSNFSNTDNAEETKTAE